MRAGGESDKWVKLGLDELQGVKWEGEEKWRQAV
jgi:hypothetical protein